MPNPQTPYIKDSEQRILNKSFDPEFDVLVFEQLEYDGNALNRKVGSTTLRWEVDGTTIYVGEAKAGASEVAAVWRITKYDTSAGSGKFADGNTSFDNVWDNRGSLTYS